MKIKIKIVVIVFLFSVFGWSQVNINSGGTNYTENFNTLTSGTWTDNTTAAGWYARTSAGTGVTIASYAANTGTNTAGGLYAFGIAGTNPLSDRALGYASSNAFTGATGVGLGFIGWRLKNNTGANISSITVTWTGEQWRRENNATAQTLNLSYQTGATVTALASGTWTSASSTFTSPITGATAGVALDGNASANRTANISVVITVNIPNGEEIMLRWEDLNDLGNDHLMGIDDVTVNATVSAGCTIPTEQASVLTPSNITNIGADFSWTNGTDSTGTMLVISPTGSSTIPSAGSTYAATTNWATAGQINTNNRVFYRGNGTSVTGITGLTPGTQYTATVYSYNDPGCYTTSVIESFNFYTLSTEPTAHSPVFSCNVISVSQIDLTFNAANTIGGNGYVILYNIGSPPTGVPTDGAYYPPGTVFGNATVLGYTSNTGTTTTYSATGLNGGTNYYFSLVPYSSNLSIPETLNYRTSATIPITNCTTVTSPEINVRGVIGSNPSISDGDVTPQGTDNTLFATVVVGNSQAKNFRIENLGNAVLNITSISFVGGNSGDFALSGITLPTTINPGSSLDFTVTFSPLASGVRNTTLTIVNNDSNENPYDFVIQGTGTTVALVDINVTGNGQSIPNNSIYPTGTNWTAFGVATVGVSTVTRTFVIENLGTTDLTLTGTPLVKITGPHAALFTVTVQPSSNTIAGGSSLSFDVVFNPNTPGFKNATIQIESNDPDENPYIFNIDGTAKGLNNIYVYGNGNDVLKGATTTTTTNLTNFGPIAVTTGIKQNTFIISNLSGATTYYSNVTISGVDAAMFTVISNPTNNGLGSGNSTSFTINFTPTSVGVKNATITFNVYTDGAHTTPDPIDPTFTFAVSGKGVLYTNCTFGPVSTVYQQDFEDIPATPTLGYTYTTNGTVSITGGTFDNGSGPKNAFIGAKSFQMAGIGTVSSGNAVETSVINLNAVDVSQYSNINFSMKVGAFRTGTVQGLDVNDLIQVDSSIDGGVNWSTEAVLRGYSNSRWDFSATGAFNAYYTGNNNGATVDTRNGGAELANGYATYYVKNLPKVSNLLLRITLAVDRSDEIWAIDNIKIEGQIPVTTTWNGTTWSAGNPAANIKAVFNGNYSTLSSLPGNIETCECQVNTGKVVNVTAGKYIEVQSDLKNNGTINVASDGSLIQVYDDASNTGTGVENISRTTTPYEKYDYTYWSSPVKNLMLGTPLGTWRMDSSYTFNTANFLDLITVATGLPPSDSFDDNSDVWVHTSTSTIMIPGKGYAVMAPTTGTFPTTKTITFSGKINNGVISIPMDLSLNNADNNDDNNLVGNPYPSAISATALINANIANISGTIAFWTHVGDAQPVTTNPGPQAYNFNSDDYALFNLTGGTRTALTTGATVLPSGYIASGQGFIIETDANQDLVFDNSMRSKTYSNSQFFRNSSDYQVDPERDRFWLNLTNTDGMFSQQLLGYFDNTTLNYDKAYDAKIDLPTSYLSFYSFINNDKYKIQARPMFAINDIVPIGYFSAVSGITTISIDATEGQFSDNSIHIYLKDNDLNTIQDLKQAPYSFYTNYGTFNNRFEIMYENALSNHEEFELTNNSVIAYNNNNLLTIKSLNASIENIKIYDVIGKVIVERNNCNENEITIANVSVSKQPLLVKIQLKDGQTVTKKVIN